MSWIIEGGGLFEVGENRATMLDRDADRRIGPRGAETATGRGLWKNSRDALESDLKWVNVSLVRAACSVFREHPTPGSSRNVPPWNRRMNRCSLSPMGRSPVQDINWRGAQSQVGSPDWVARVEAVCHAEPVPSRWFDPC